MTSMYVTLVSTYIFSFLARIAKDKKYKLLSLFWLALTATVLIVFAGYRSGSIGDTGMYMHSYELYANDPSLINFDRDGGFTLINLILIQFSTNGRFLVIVTSLITQLLNMIVFYKYSSYFELQVFIYIAAGYLTVSMNGMRQCLVAAILFIFTNLIIEGKFKAYLIIVILLSSVHGSAIIMIPLYFIVREEAWSKKVVLMIILAVIGIVGYNIISPIFFKMLEDTQYGVYSTIESQGSSFIRTLVNMVPILLAYLKRNELKEKWPESNVFINMALINVIFVAFGMFNWIFNRFTIYMQLYNFILIPYIVKKCFKGKEKRLFYFGVIICYFIFFYREQVIGLNMHYKLSIDFKDLFYK